MCLRDLPALTRMLEARAAGAAARSHARLVSTYFDTSDRALAEQGLTLRVRERDGHFVQTVKSGSGNGGGALVRGEWEDPIGGASPDPLAPVSGRFVPPGTAGRLIPLFRTEIARCTIALSPTRETQVEAAIDRGQVDALCRSGSEPICEIELELKRGDTAVLYDVALELLAVAPARLERRSKSSRGYRLAAPQAEPETIRPVHAAAVDLDPGMTGHEALRRIGRSCTEQIVQNEAAVLAGMPEGIHQMRVGIRRLRAILSAFAPLLSEDQRQWSSAELRWLGSALGAARSLDVFQNGLVAPAQKALGEIRGITALNAAVEQRRAAANAEAAEALRSTRYAGLILRLMRWCEGGGWRGHPASPALDERIGDIAAGILDRRRGVVKRHGRSFKKQSPEQRHELRIALKKLRYAAEMLGQFYDAGAVGRFLKRVKQLQEELGDANDLRASQEIVAELEPLDAGFGAIAGAGAAVLDWNARHLPEREPKMGKQLARLLASPPFWSN